MKAHAERKHSKFSASGSERWFNCPGSVALSEGMPSKDSIWSIEGTKAHETLEKILRHCAAKGQFLGAKIPSHIMTVPGQTKDMLHYGNHAAGVILGNHWKTPGSELLVETRISLDFIHPAAFGTFDGAVVDHFGTLHVYDYKYGAGHAVSPGTPKDPNLQMAFYGLGLAYRYDWNFKRVRLWIIQPRIRGYTGPTFVEMTIADLRGVWAPTFKKAVRRVEREPKRMLRGHGVIGVTPRAFARSRDKQRPNPCGTPLPTQKTNRSKDNG